MTATARRPQATGTVAPGLRLDVGCGSRLREGHVGVDLRALPGVRYVCNAWELPLHLAPHSVAGIYSRHFFEHLTFAQGAAGLHALAQVLQPGAALWLTVPDIRWHMQQFLQARRGSRSAAHPRWSAREHALAGFWGWQREGIHELWDVHKAGYDETSLIEAVAAAGFVGASRQPDQAWNLSVLAHAP